MPLKHASSMVGCSFSDYDLKTHQNNFYKYKVREEFKDGYWQARIGICTSCNSLTTVINPIFRNNFSEKSFLCIDCCFPKNNSIFNIPSLDRTSSGG